MNKRKSYIPLIVVTNLILASGALAQNPYLPPWEYVPDGEPRVFRRSSLYIWFS
jgi:hypothetical protein